MNAGTVLGRYVLLNRISAGGMAEVYRARLRGAAGFERLVAVKVMLPALVEDEQFVDTLVEEAKLTVQLNHACIAHTSDLGHEGDQLYIAMEYVAGRDLRSVLNRMRKQGMPVPAAMSCYIIGRLADALDYAHSKKDAHGHPLNIVHRDISPSNLLVSYEGECKLIDFGIARASSRVSQTGTGVIKGKIAYMSPEQVTGAKIDHRTDIYAAGVMLWELLTGARLFQADSEPALLRMVAEAQVPRPTTVVPNVEPELEEGTLRALAADPNDRYQRAGELRDALAHYALSRRLKFGREEMSQLMHALFPDEITAEREIVTAPVPAVPDEAVPAAAVSTAQFQAADAAAAVAKAAEIPAPRRSRTWILAALGGVVLLAGGAGAGFLLKARSVAELTVTAEPRDARLLVDGQVVQLTGGRAVVKRLQPGPHSVYATREGYEEAQEDVELVASEKRALALRLVAKLARLNVITNPAGAAVTVGGAPRGLTPANLEIAPGAFEIAVKLDCVEEKRTLELKPAETQRLELTLDVAKCQAPPPSPPEPTPPPPPKKVARQQPAPPKLGPVGYLQLTSMPKGEVWVDGKPTGKSTPIIKHPLPPGDHKIRVVAGRTAKEVAVKITQDKVEQVFVILQ